MLRIILWAIFLIGEYFPFLLLYFLDYVLPTVCEHWWMFPISSPLLSWLCFTKCLWTLVNVCFSHCLRKLRSLRLVLSSVWDYGVPSSVWDPCTINQSTNQYIFISTGSLTSIHVVLNSVTFLSFSLLFNQSIWLLITQYLTLYFSLSFPVIIRLLNFCLLCSDISRKFWLPLLALDQALNVT